MTRLRKPQRGMTLIEVLISILLFSFGILGMVGLLARATQISVDADDRNRASLLANEIAAQLWASRVLTLPQSVVTDLVARSGLGTDTTVTIAPPAGGGAALLTPVNTAAPATGGQPVVITIIWKEPGRKAGQEQGTYQTQVVVG